MIKSYLNYSALFIMVYGVFSLSLFGQTPQKHNLKKEIEELMYSNPNQAIKIAQHLLSNPNITSEERIKVNILISKSFYAKGDFSAALKALYEEKKLSISDKIEVEVLKASLFRKLSLLNESESEIKKCESIILNISDKKKLERANSFLKIEKAKFYIVKENYDKALEVLNQDELKSIVKTDKEISIWYHIILAKVYLEKKHLKLAKAQYDKVLQMCNDNKPLNLYVKTYALSGLASICFLEKNHLQASNLLEESLKNSNTLDNIFLKELIIRQQIVNYLALNDTTNYKLAHKEFNKINNEVELLEQDAINDAYNLISNEYNENYHKSKNSFFSILYMFFSFLGLLVFFGVFYLFKYYQRKKSLDEIIRYLEITRKNIISRLTANESNSNELPKRIFILEETEKLILSKLKRFESSNRFTSKDISLAVLAGQLDTNTKYLSEIINTHYNVNFNTYINRLRINYLVEKLKTDPNYINYKISFLAEDCGFASHSSFTTVFKSITGISPVTFIDLLKEEKQATAV